MNPRNLHRMARDELRAQRSYWTDRSHFQPMLPPELAARLRVPCYIGAITLAAVGIAPLLHSTVDPLGVAVAGGVMALLSAVNEQIGRDTVEDRPQPRLPAPRVARTRFPPAYVGETKRLIGEE